MGQDIVCLLPGLNHFLIALFLGDQTAAVILRDLVYCRLRVGDQLLLRGRHGHIRNGNGHGRPGGILVSHGLDGIQGLRCLNGSMDIDDLFQDLLQALFAHMEIDLQEEFIAGNAPVHKAQVLGNDLVEQETAHRGFHDSGFHCPVFHRPGHTDLYPGMKGHGLILIGEDCLVDALEDHTFAFGAGTLLGQIINTKHHILRRHCHGTAVGGLQQVVR